MLPQDIRSDQLYKIWALTPLGQVSADDPRAINYKTGLITRLQPEEDFNTGYLTSVKYFEDLSNADSLIVDVSIEYNEEEKLRKTVRKYTIEEGTFGDYVKEGVKTYNQTQWETVQKRRRQNIIDILTANASKFGILPYVQDLWRTLNAELIAYVSTGDKTLIGSIISYEGSWLEYPSDVTGFSLRDAIVYRLNFDTVD